MGFGNDDHIIRGLMRFIKLTSKPTLSDDANDLVEPPIKNDVVADSMEV